MRQKTRGEANEEACSTMKMLCGRSASQQNPHNRISKRRRLKMPHIIKHKKRTFSFDRGSTEKVTRESLATFFQVGYAIPRGHKEMFHFVNNSCVYCGEF